MLIRVEAQGELLDVVVGGLRHSWTREERERLCRPPYPLPDELEPVRARVLRELRDLLPDDGDGPLVVERIRASPHPYRSAVHVLGLPSHVFELQDAVCALVAAGALTLAQAELLSAEGLVRGSSGLPRQVVLVHLAAGRLEQADTAAEAVGEYAWLAHRDVAAHLVDQVDVEGFLARWPRYAAGKDTRQMRTLRSSLVAAVAGRDGWRAGIELTNHRRFGAAYRGAAFRSLMQAGDVDQLVELFAGPAADLLGDHGELAAICRAIVAASPPKPEQDHPALADVVDRLIAIDPSVSKAQMRLRDNLLWTLWSAIGERATLDRVRGAVRTPTIRRELRVLARDLPH